MALVTRFTRLFRADMHAVLDRLEEPDVLLRQAIREMEDDVARRTRSQQARTQERRQVEARLAELVRSHQALAGELDLCFQVGNEALARSLLRRRLEAERLEQHLAQLRSRLDETVAEEGAALEEHRHRLEALRQRAAALELEPRPGPGPARATATMDLRVTDEDVEIAWLREQQKRRPS